MKKLTVLVTIILALSMIMTTAMAADYEITYSTKSAGSTQDQAMDLFAQKLEELSGGRIVGKKYIAGTIGGEEELAEAVALGDLGATFAADVLIGNCAGGCLGWESLPGLVTSYDEVKANIFDKEGWISKIIDNLMETKCGLKRLAGGDNCFRVLGVNKEIVKASDLNGVKIRAGNSWENLQLYERAGAMPVVIASSETLSALEQGTVDGAENGILNLASSGIQDAISYVLEVNMMYSPASIVVNLDWFNGLSAEDQAIVTEAAQDAAVFEIQATADAIAALKEKQTASGQWTMLEMNDDLTKTFSDAAASMWVDATEKYGAEIMDQLNANKK